MKQDEFYIGWLGQAPPSFARFIKKYLLLVLPVVMLLGFLISGSQKKFGTGNFEFGQRTEVKGLYLAKPVSRIRVLNGKDILGNPSYLTIPLVGYGKMGAEGILSALEQESHTSLDQKEITLKGTLLYNDGKTLLQIDANDHPLTYVSQVAAPTDQLPRMKDLGTMTFKGEIIDPKCYFGVMKPGEGKPHRDCAIRCILGGIPPMLAVKERSGAANYYLLVNEHGKKVNELVQDLVAEPLEVKAHAMQLDDWIVLYLDDQHSFTKLSGSERFQPGPALACRMQEVK